MHKIILASNSKVRKKILDGNGVECKVFPSNINEEMSEYCNITEEWMNPIIDVPFKDSSIINS